ncbi:MAG: EAL domain-containing protein [Deltaproteobacteria bacterium]|nr:EAL domain-containing protein [Deltaproteobacteria bacterium]
MGSSGQVPLPRSVSTRSQRGRVLVVDDDELMLRTTRRVLEQMGFEVDLAPGGEVAVALIEHTRFDVVVSDISMPGIDGIELLKLIREKDLDVPVVMITGQPGMESAVRSLEYGALHYLTKPLDIPELEKTLDRGVRLHEVARMKREAFELLGGEAKLAGDRAGLEASFTRALDGLWIAYQPIVRSIDGSIYGYEALLRSDEPTLPGPMQVIDAAERLRRLPELGRAIRGRAAGPFDPGPFDPDGRPENLFVNLHPRDLEDDSLIDPASPLVKVANHIIFEITERASVHEIHNLRERIAELRKVGYRIAVDDLGAGYAGLTAFAHLEPDFVKFDMSLVRDVEKNATKRKLIGSMARVSKELGMMVVAEGIETVPERDVLIDLGCDLLQGFLLARPGRPFPPAAWPPRGS